MAALDEEVAQLLWRALRRDPALADDPDQLRAQLEEALGAEADSARAHLDALTVVAIHRLTGDGAGLDPSVLERWERVAPGWLPWASSVWDVAATDTEVGGDRPVEVVVQPLADRAQEDRPQEDRPEDTVLGPRASLGAGALLVAIALLSAGLTFGLLRDDTVAVDAAPPTTAAPTTTVTTAAPGPPPDISEVRGPELLTGGIEAAFTVEHDGATSVSWLLTVDDQTVEIGTGDSVSFTCASRPQAYEVQLAVEADRSGAVAREERALPCVPAPSGSVEPSVAELAVGEDVAVVVGADADETWRLVAAGGDATLAGSAAQLRFACAGATRSGPDGGPVTYVEVYLATVEQASAQLAASVDAAPAASIDRPTGSVTRSFEVVFANGAGAESRQAFEVTCAAPPPPAPPADAEPPG